MDAYDNSAKLFKALMHPARLEILDILRDGEALRVPHRGGVGPSAGLYLAAVVGAARGRYWCRIAVMAGMCTIASSQPQVFALLDVAIDDGGRPAEQTQERASRGVG